MSKFDFMNFTCGGVEESFVAHACKYTKRQALKFCVKENADFIEKEGLRLPQEGDVIRATVKYFINPPDYCESDREGLYTFCQKGTRGSFPVWVIEFDNLRETEWFLNV